MDSNLSVAIVTAGFTSLVAIACIIYNKRLGNVRSAISDLRSDVRLLTGTVDKLHKRFIGLTSDPV